MAIGSPTPNVDLKLTEIRQEQRGQNNTASHPVRQCVESPESLIPRQLVGPLVWSGSDFEDENPNTLFLGARDIVEIEEALESFKDLELDGDQVGASNFPLPTLGKVLETFADSVLSGQGFFIVHGLNLNKYSVEDSVISFLGIASHVGDKRGLQDKKGNVLAHITSSRTWDVPMSKRHGIHSTVALPFHSDMGCDILALQVRNTSPRGGCTYLSSASTVFNKLNEHEHDVVKVLFEQNWPFQYSLFRDLYYLAPVMAIQDNHLMTSVDPQRLGPHPADATSSVPRLTKDQKHALERLDKVARSKELRLNLRRGDFLFANNWALIHRRDSYDDEGDTPRHLVRLWLRNSKHAWSVPSSMLLPWQAAYGDGVQNIPRRYALHPVPKYFVPKYSAGSSSFLMEDGAENADIAFALGRRVDDCVRSQI